jgi:hypothetical protein
MDASVQSASNSISILIHGQPESALAKLHYLVTETTPSPVPIVLESLTTLFETKRGKKLPLPPRLASLYGSLRSRCLLPARFRR